MDLNLTDIEYGSEDVVGPEPGEAQVLYESLQDIDRVDEAALMISNYAPSQVIVDVSDEYFIALREELEDLGGIKVTMGVDYESDY